MARGRITSMNQGVLMDMIIRVPSTTRVHQMKLRMLVGNIMSIVSMSLVNLRSKQRTNSVTEFIFNVELHNTVHCVYMMYLLRILPLGVVSKNVIGHLSMFRRRFRWRRFEAYQAPIASITEAPNEKTPTSQNSMHKYILQ